MIDDNYLTKSKIQQKTILLIGLMGCGKTSVGKRLARMLDMRFVDADSEIEKAAGLSVSDIFKLYGETEFRSGERRVMKRLLEGKPCIIASGGGAFMSEETRNIAKENAISIWLKADLDVLSARTAGRDHRPLLAEGDATEKLRKLMDERNATYALADITVKSNDEHPEKTANRVLRKITTFFEKNYD